MTKKLHKIASVILVIIMVASSYSTAAFGIVYEYDRDYIHLSSAVIPGRSIVRNRRGAEKYRIYDTAYRDETLLIQADLPGRPEGSNNLRIAIYEYRDLELAFGAEHVKRLPSPDISQYGAAPGWHKDFFIEADYGRFSPPVNYDFYSGALSAVRPVGWLTGILNGVQMEFGYNGADVGAYDEDEPLVIEWLCDLPRAEQNPTDYYLLVFSFIEEHEGPDGKKYTDVNDKNNRYLPMELRFGSHWINGVNITDTVLDASVVQRLLVKYGLAEDPKLNLGELPEWEPGFYAPEFESMWGGVNLACEDLRLEGANPLVFERRYNSLHSYMAGHEDVRDDIAIVERATNHDFGYLGWSHNYYYRLYYTGILSEDGRMTGWLDIYLPGGVRMEFSLTASGIFFTENDGAYVVRFIDETDEDLSEREKSGFLLENIETGETVRFAHSSGSRRESYLGFTSIYSTQVPVEIADASGDKTEINYLMFANGYPSQTLSSISNSSGSFDFTYTGYNTSEGVKYGVSRVADSAGRVVEYEYNNTGNLIRVADAEQIITEYDYDNTDCYLYFVTVSGDKYDILARRNLITEIRSGRSGDLSVTASYEYRLMGHSDYHNKDLTNGKVTRIIKPGYPTTSYEYFNPGKGEMSGDGPYVRETVGNPSNYYSQTVTYYDKEFRPVVIRTHRAAGSSSADVIYKYYGSSSRINSVTDHMGNITFYDYWEQDFAPLGGAYRETSLISKIDYPDGSNETVKYNDKGQPTSITSKASSMEPGFGVPTLTFTYYPDGHAWAGRLMRESLGSGYREYTYDANYFIETVVDGYAGGVVRTTTYANNPNGKPYTMTVQDHLAAGQPYYTTQFKYDAVGRTTRVTSPEGRVNAYEYSPNGNLTAEYYYYDSSLPDARYAKLYEYNHKGFVRGYTNWHIENSSDPATRAVWTYTDTDAYGRTTRIYGDAVDETDYTYDDIGNIRSASVLDSRVDGDGFAYFYKTTEYTYNRLGCVMSMTDPNGNVTSFAHDANGNLTVELKPNGGVQIARWDEMNQFLGYGYPELDESGEATFLYTYDGSGQVKTETDGAGNTTKYDYDRYGNLIRVTKPGNKVTTYDYNWENKPIRVTTPEGNVTEYEYNGMGWITKATTIYTDAEGNKVRCTISTEYDKDGLVTAAISAEGHRTDYTYDRAGNLRTVTYPQVWDGENGENRQPMAEYTYDANRNRLTEKDPRGNTTNYYYDKAGRVETIAEPGGKTTRFTYTAGGNTAKQEDAYGYVTEYKYDANDNLIEIRDPKGNTTFYVYDRLNRLIQARAPQRNFLDYTYDNNNNLTKITQPDGGETIFFYDGANRLVEERKLMDKAKGLYAVKSYEYDGVGNLVKETDAMGKDTIYRYDDDNRLIHVKPPTAVSINDGTTYEYDGVGNLIRATTPDGATNYVYDKDNRLIKVTTPEWNVTEYFYDALGRLTEERYQYGSLVPDRGDRIFYEYDANGNLTRVTDANNSFSATPKFTSYEYDALDRLTRVTDPEGNVQSIRYATWEQFPTTFTTDPNEDTTRVVYDGNGNIIRILDARGKETLFLYDMLDRVTQMIDADGKSTYYEYSEMGYVTKVTKPTGGVFGMEYNEGGLLTRETDPYDHEILREYDLNGNMTRLTDRNGNVTEYAYDAGNRLTGVTNIMDGGIRYVTEYQYDHMGRVTRMTEGTGGSDQAVTRMSYDGDGRVTQEANPLYIAPLKQNSVFYEYDLRGFVRSVIHEDGAQTGYTYDANGNVLTKTDERGNKTTYTYNGNNQVLTETDPLGGETTYAYTKTGKVKSVTDPMYGVTSYEYDKNGNVTAIVDPERNRTEFDYDPMNRPVAQRLYEGNKLLSKTTFGYDANGNLAEISHPDGGREQFTYDLNDQTILYETYNLDKTETYATTYGYDNNGNLTEITDPRNNTRKIEYDALGRATKFINEIGAEVSFEYDALGRVKRSTNEDGATTAYEYDAKGRATRISDALGHYRIYGYDARDRVIGEIDENGVTRTFSYDNAGNLTVKTDGLGHTESFAYDANGNMTAYTDRNGHSTYYGYDALNRVTSERGEGEATGSTFGYDGNGRITSVTDQNGNTTTYTLDGNGNIVEAKDADGFSNYFEYDEMNRLKAVRQGKGASQITQAKYEYDHRGLVITEVNALNQAKQNEYDGNGNLVKVTDEDGYVTVYDYNEVNLVRNVSYNREKSATFLYNGTGELIEFTDWTGTTSYTRDRLNRVTAVTAPDTGTVEYGYDPVGNTTSILYPDGRQADYYYNAENRAVRLVDADDGEFRFSYDSSGNLVFTEYPNYETAYRYYDANGRLVQTDEYAPGGLHTVSSLYSWDPAGNLLREREYSAVATATGGDDGFCAEVASASAGLQGFAGNELSISVTEANGRVIEESVTAAAGAAGPHAVGGHNVYVEISPSGQIVECYLAGAPPNPHLLAENNPWMDGVVNGSPLSSGTGRKSGAPDKGGYAGPREEPQEPGPAAPVAKDNEYTYDSLNRMRNSYDGVSKTYIGNAYDGAGNLTQEDYAVDEGNGGFWTVGYVYDEMNRPIRKDDGAADERIDFHYDGRGNLTEKESHGGRESYVYDATNHMTEASTGGGVSTYTYNALSMRVGNTQIADGGAVARYYAVDHTNALGSYRNDLMEEAAGAEAYTQDHVYLGVMRVAQTTDAGDGGGGTLYVHEDLRGTTRRYTAAEDGALCVRMDYGVWGEPLGMETYGAAGANAASYITPDFAGHEYDAVMDMFYGQARFYDAENRTWAARDPARDGTNWYNYCEDNPASSTDITGYGFWSFLKDVFNAIVNAIKFVVNLVLDGLDFIFGWIPGLGDLVHSVTGAVRTVVDFGFELLGAVAGTLADIGEALFTADFSKLGSAIAEEWTSFGGYVADNWQNLVSAILVAAQIGLAILTFGTSALLNMAIAAAAVGIAGEILPSCIAEQIMYVISAAGCLISGNWLMAAAYIGDAIIEAALSYAAEQILKVVSKIEALSFLVKGMIGVLKNVDWSAVVNGLMDQGLAFLTAQVDYYWTKLTDLVDYVMSIDVGQLLANAGQYVVDFAREKIDQGVAYLNGMIDKGMAYADWILNDGFDYAINYLTQKGMYYINYAESLFDRGMDAFNNFAAYGEKMLNRGMDIMNGYVAYGERLLNRGMDIANNYVTYGERLVSKGLARAEQALNRGIRYTQAQLNQISKLPNVLSNRMEAFSSQLPSMAGQITRQVALRGQQEMVRAIPRIATAAQQTMSRHMGRVAQQMFGRPPFTAPSYGI